MNVASDAEVIAAVLGYHRMVLDKDQILRRAVEAPWALEVVWNLVYDDPERCWRLLNAMAKTHPGDDVMTWLGVTLGWALRERPSLIEKIEEDVRADATVSELLSWVMQDRNIQPDVWRRLENLSTGQR